MATPVAGRVVGARTGLLDALSSISYIRPMNLDMNDVQTGVLIRELHGIIQSDRYPPQSTHCGTEGDPGAATAGACSYPGSAATEDLRTTHQGQVAPTPRLGTTLARLEDL